MRKSVRAVVAVLGLALATTASAGFKLSNPVVIDPVSRTLYGDIGTARNSADPTQMLYTYVYTTAATQFVVIFARDAAGNTARCSSSSPQFINAVAGANGDSYLYVQWDANAVCTYVYLENASSYRQPKAP